MFHCPSGVFGDERLWIPGGLLQGGESQCVAAVPERYANIAEEATAFGAQHWRSSEGPLEPNLVQGEEVDQVGRGEFRPEVWFHQFTCLGEPVPGAGSQAVITSIDAIADERTKFDWNGPLEFDGQIRNAPAGIELERRRDRLGGTSGQTARALAAAIVLRFIGDEVERRDDLGQKEPVPELSTDQVSVLADEPDTGALREIPLQEWAGIHIPERPGVWTSKFVYEVGKFPEVFAADGVIVGVPGVTRDFAGRP